MYSCIKYIKRIWYINLEEGRGASGNPPHTGPSTTISSWTTNWSTHCRAQEGLWNHACTSNMFTTGHGNHDSKNGVTFGVALLLAKKRGVQNLSNQAKRAEAIVFISTPVIRAGHGIATHLSWSVAIPCPLAGLARYTKTQVYRVAHVLVFYISNPYE